MHTVEIKLNKRNLKFLLIACGIANNTCLGNVKNHFMKGYCEKCVDSK